MTFHRIREKSRGSYRVIDVNFEDNTRIKRKKESQFWKNVTRGTFGSNAHDTISERRWMYRRRSGGGGGKVTKWRVKQCTAEVIPVHYVYNEHSFLFNGR